jgi:hypothetical protein
MTRWHGISRPIGFRPTAPPTARAAPGFPMRRATSPYEAVAPRGIVRTPSSTRRSQSLTPSGTAGTSKESRVPARCSLSSRSSSARWARAAGEAEGSAAGTSRRLVRVPTDAQACRARSVTTFVAGRRVGGRPSRHGDTAAARAPGGRSRPGYLGAASPECSGPRHSSAGPDVQAVMILIRMRPVLLGLLAMAATGCAPAPTPSPSPSAVTTPSPAATAGSPAADATVADFADGISFERPSRGPAGSPTTTTRSTTDRGPTSARIRCLPLAPRGRRRHRIRPMPGDARATGRWPRCRRTACW